ncbi:MAG: hypothetical protein JRC60_00450 [Deltaproteobacteria bacterium]|nr:hypothetical protein [Deltaproteobacteria bacterium]
MGIARPKIKDEVHYKKGLTWAYCSDCNHFVRDYQVTGIAGRILGIEPRCRIIGLKPGRGYRINPTYICDHWDNSNYMKRLRGY